MDNNLSCVKKQFTLFNSIPASSESIADDAVEDPILIRKKLMEIFTALGFKKTQIREDQESSFTFENEKILYKVDYSDGENDIIVSIDEIIDCDYSNDFLEEKFSDYSSIEKFEDFLCSIKDKKFDYLQTVWIELKRLEDKFSSKLPVDFEEILMDKFSLS